MITRRRPTPVRERGLGGSTASLAASLWTRNEGGIVPAQLFAVLHARPLVSLRATAIRLTASTHSTVGHRHRAKR